MRKSRTKTITQTSVETVEISLHECPVCGIEHEADEMVEIGVDKRREGKSKTVYEHSDTLCMYCAESLFNYERPEKSGWTNFSKQTEYSLRYLAYLWVVLIVCAIVLTQDFGTVPL